MRDRRGKVASMNYKQACVSSLVGSAEFFPMLAYTGKFCSTGLCLPLFFLAFPFSRSLDYGMLINYKRYTSGFKEGYRSHWATEKLKQKQKQSFWFFFPPVLCSEENPGMEWIVNSLPTFILVGIMHAYTYSLICEFMMLNDHKYYIYMIWKDKYFSVVWEYIPFKLHLLTKYLLNINLTRVTYNEIIGMIKNKNTFCNGSFELEVNLFKNSFGVFLINTFRAVFCGFWISESEVLLRI